MAYIHYDQKSIGVIYASLYESFRDKGKVKTRRVENLGRVIDKNNNSIQNTLLDESDTLLDLILYRLLINKGASCHAKIWHEGNYSYLAFPHANLTSQNISRIPKELGRESRHG